MKQCVLYLLTDNDIQSHTLDLLDNKFIKECYPRLAVTYGRSMNICATQMQRFFWGFKIYAGIASFRVNPRFPRTSLGWNLGLPRKDPTPDYGSPDKMKMLGVNCET